jgi:hypothetical protein
MLNGVTSVAKRPSRCPRWARSNRSLWQTRDCTSISAYRMIATPDNGGARRSAQQLLTTDPFHEPNDNLRRIVLSGAGKVACGFRRIRNKEPRCEAGSTSLEGRPSHTATWRSMHLLSAQRTEDALDHTGRIRVSRATLTWLCWGYRRPHRRIRFQPFAGISIPDAAQPQTAF